MDWDERGVVTGVNVFARSAGSAVGVAVFGAIATNVIAAGRGEHHYGTIVAASTWVFVAVAITNESGDVGLAMRISKGSAASPFTFTVRANVQGSAVPFAMRAFSIDGTDLSFSYTAPPGVTYRLRRSQTMLPGSWTTVPGYSSMGSAAAPQTIVISDLINPAQPADFFRLEQNP